MAEIGSTLREARMRARIDISEVETKTKIRAKYLRAIENEEWDLLPGPVYVKSFLKTYADYLGLDSRLLIDEYKRRYERPDHDTHTIATIHREREQAAKGPVIPSWMITVVVLALILGALYVVGKGVSGSGSGKTSSNANPPVRPHHHGAHRSHPSTTTTATTTTTPSQTLATVHLVPTGSVYVCVKDANGKKLIPGIIYSAGQTIPEVRSTKLLITLGNDSVTMKADGKPYPIAASSAAIGLEVLPTGVTPLPAAKAPVC